MNLPEIQQAIEALPAPGQRTLLLWLLRRSAPWSAPPQPRKPPTLRQAVQWTVLCILAFVLIDAAIFRSGWYYRYLEPDSTTGQAEAQLFWLSHEAPKGPEAAVIGDSRIEAGFSARTATTASANKLRFWNLGIAGSSPRTWYYLLRDGDPTHRRFKAIAFGIDHYSDQENGVVLANSVRDLNYVIGRLRLTDCLDFSRSFEAPELHRPMLTGCLFKAFTLRRDVQELFLHPKARLARARDIRNQGHGYIDGYEGKPEEMTGLTADFTNKTLHFPPGLKDWQEASSRDMIFPADVPQTPRMTEYRRLWLGRILDLYKDSPTRLIFLELPRTPIPIPEMPTPARYIDSIRNRPRITVLPQQTFRDLERPDAFADGLHLNHTGRPVFSERLGRLIADAAETK